MNFEDNRGITLVALVVTIIVLLILAGIGINTGISSMEKVKLEELKTNMLLIEAKARECVEEANFRMGATTDETVVESVRKEIYEVNNKLEKANSTNVPNSPGEIDLTDCYVITKETFDLWGLNKIKLSEDEKYLVRFNEKEIKVEEVYNTKGYDGKYSLTEIES